MTLTVVLPALNEAMYLPATLRTLAEQTRPAERVVVVDGGSTDGTLDSARAFNAETLVVTDRGRGGQIAEGIASCREDIVLIAHADMTLPAHALQRLTDYLTAHADCPGGCLGHRFMSSHPVFRVIEWWDRSRARRGVSYGDQAQFVRRAALERVGGFPDLPIMEDVELAHRLRQLGQPAYLNIPVGVSTRRYDRNGVARVAWLNWCCRRAYRRGGAVGCWKLHDRYYRR